MARRGHSRTFQAAWHKQHRLLHLQAALKALKSSRIEQLGGSTSFHSYPNLSGLNGRAGRAGRAMPNSLGALTAVRDSGKYRAHRRISVRLQLWLFLWKLGKVFAMFVCNVAVYTAFSRLPRYRKASKDIKSMRTSFTQVSSSVTFPQIQQRWTCGCCLSHFGLDPPARLIACLHTWRWDHKSASEYALALAFSGILWLSGQQAQNSMIYWCLEHLPPKPTDHQSQFLLLHSNTLHEIIEMRAAWFHFEGLLVARHYNQGLCLVATYHRNSYQHPPQLQLSNRNICIAKGRGKSMMEIGYNHHIVNKINSNQTHLPYLLPHTPCWYLYIYIYSYIFCASILDHTFTGFY